MPHVDEFIHTFAGEETLSLLCCIAVANGNVALDAAALSPIDASGIPPQVVMKWTGHSDYKAMRPYIDIAEKTKAAAMSLFDENLKK